MDVPWHPGVFAGDLLGTHDRINLGDGGQARVPDGLRVVVAERGYQLRQPRIRDHRQVRAGVARIDRGAPVALEDGDRASRGRQQVRRRSGP
jgi:hypothetical protein